jgi:hypothetical protein
VEGVIDANSHFLNRLGQCMSMAAITSSAAQTADSLYHETPSRGSISGIVIGLCLITLFSNLFGVRVCILLTDRITESMLTVILADIR